MAKIPIVAIVGRTNVGKSTLFNRLAEKRKALVSPKPGTTRDRNEAEIFWRGKIFTAVDTGGTDSEFGEEIEKATHQQIDRALENADLVLFVVDMKTGPLPQERELAKKLKTLRKPIIVVGNKAEKMFSPNLYLAPEWRLAGLSLPFLISALRGAAIGDLLDLVHKELRRIKCPPLIKKEEIITKVAIIGRPNVGKSSIVNAILGEERFITSPMAHTTREPIDTLVEVNKKKYLLVDTAGIRKSNKTRKAGGLEAAGVVRSKELIKDTDVVVLVLEANEPINAQDKNIAGILEEATAGVIIVANKWDLIPEKTTNTVNEYTDYIQNMMPFISWAPIIFTSAKTGQRIENIFSLVDAVQASRNKEISEEELEKFFRKTLAHRGPIRGKCAAPPKALGLRQTGTCPPSFVVTIKAKRTDAISQSYLRYIANRLHKEFNFIGTPVVVKARLPRVVAN